MTPEQFREDLEKSLGVINRKSGADVIGYRAPAWSVRRDMTWFFEILESRGLLYDSSLFPARTYLYGDSRTPRFPFRVGSRLEIPPSTLDIAGIRLPFSGGAAFRFISFRDYVESLVDDGGPGSGSY